MAENIEQISCQDGLNEEHALCKEHEDSSSENISASCKKEKTENALPTVHDPFAYIKEKGFTTEIYKIEIQNLPKRFGIQQLRKMMHAQGLNAGKIKAVDFGHYAFVNFRSADERDLALEKLQGHVWKGKQLRVKEAKPTADPLVQKRKQHAEFQNEEESKKRKRDTDESLPIEERLKNAVTPLWNVPYEEQLKDKEKTMREYLVKFTKAVCRDNYGKEYQQWLKQKKQENDGLACSIHPIKSSPVLEKYRNKCEFSVGLGPNDVEKTVGFRIGNYKGGCVMVVEPESCMNIPDSMKEVTKEFQKCLQASNLQRFDLADRTGHWYQVTVRTTTLGDVMAFVKMHPQNLTKEELEKEKEFIKHYFMEGPGQECRIDSLYFQIQTDREKEPSEETLLRGKTSITERLLGLKFQISPAAFFQVNTPAAEVLYRQVDEWANTSNETILLDVCCGTGTIGLSMAKSVKKVIGIELCKEAIEDAKVNATLNGIENAEFHCGKAEDVLPWLTKRLKGLPIVAVVDPPRDGLQSSVILALRKTKSIKSVIYVSCKPNGAFNNIVDLTRSESRRVQGPAFKLTEAVPVDLFPHTPHCELVMRFERPELDHKLVQSNETTTQKTIDNTIYLASDSSSKVEDNEHKNPACSTETEVLKEDNLQLTEEMTST